MTYEQVEEAVKRRKAGESCKAIADYYGVSRQYIWSITHENRRKIYNSCIYKGFAEFIKTNNLTLTKIGKDLGMSIPMLSLKFRGKKKFTAKEIDKILQYTGMTYDECFTVT